MLIGSPERTRNLLLMSATPHNVENPNDLVKAYYPVGKVE